MLEKTIDISEFDNPISVKPTKLFNANYMDDFKSDMIYHVGTNSLQTDRGVLMESKVNESINTFKLARDTLVKRAAGSYY